MSNKTSRAFVGNTKEVFPQRGAKPVNVFRKLLRTAVEATYGKGPRAEERRCVCATAI